MADLTARWLGFYKRSLPNFRGALGLAILDKTTYRGGNARILRFANGSTIRVLEKVDNATTGNMWLEQTTTREKEYPGWCEKGYVVDLLAYAYPNTRQAYLFHWSEFRAMYQTYKDEWESAYGVKTLNSYESYTVSGILIPIRDVLSAIPGYLEGEF